MTPHDLLLARRSNNSQRLNREDNCHLALVVEGGGMRGVIAGGMTTAFEDEGFLDAFDSIHGSSAGGCVASSFAVGQAKIGTAVYSEDISNAQFIRPSRMLFGKPAVDINFLIEHVVRTIRKMDAKKIVDAPGFLHLVLTNATTGEEKDINTYRDEDYFFEVLKATICLPFFGGRPIEIDGQPCFDGGLLQQIPYKSAVNAGATHIIVLMTRAQSALIRKSRRKGFQYQVMGLSLLYNRKIGDIYKHKNDLINEELAEILAGRTAGGGQVDSIVPTGDGYTIGRLTKDPETLKKAELDGRNAALAYLQRPQTG